MRLSYVPLFVILVAGCSESRTGAVVGGDGGNGMTGDAVPGVDDDGDGILNEIDNCPLVHNAQQYDEDRDGVGNVCDNCPAVPNEDQANFTEDTPDGLGDACDPYPFSHNDIVLFIGFDDPDELANWQVLDGTWEISDGSLEQTDLITRAQITYASPVGNDLLRIDTAATYFNTGNMQEAPFFFRGGGVMAHRSDSNDSGYACWLLRNLSAGQDGYTVMSLEPNGNALYNEIAERSFLLGTKFQQALVLDRDNKHCYVTEAGLSEDDALIVSRVMEGGDNMGFIVYATSARFDYFFVTTFES